MLYSEHFETKEITVKLLKISVMRNFNVSSLTDKPKEAALHVFGRKTLLKFWLNFIGLILLFVLGVKSEV